MKKIICGILLFLGCCAMVSADEVNGVAVSNATTGVFNMRLTFDGIEWNGTDSVEISGTLMNQSQNEAHFIGVLLTLKNAVGELLAEKSVESRPQTILSNGFGEFDVLLNCSEKPALLIYEVTGQN